MSERVGRPYRLVVADLDGTLMGNDLVISPGVRQAVASLTERGIYFTVATGRSFHAAMPFTSQLSINAPLILYQGGEIREMGTAALLHQAAIPLDAARAFITTINNLGLHLNVYLDDGVYVARMTPEAEFYASMHDTGLRAVGDLLGFVQAAPSKMLIVGDPDRLDELAPRLTQQFAGKLQVVRSHLRFLEAIPTGVDKGVGLAWLARYLGVAREDTVAIGDNDNDAEMVAWAGLGFAMGDASPAVKGAADVVAPPVGEDGVAWAIHEYVLPPRHGRRE